MTIDWSKAPKDATHARVEEGRVWIWRKKTAQGDWMAWHYESWNYIAEPTPELYIARPVSWTGEGLPPVGTVCEHNWRGEWHRVTVMATVQGYPDRQEVIVQRDGDWTFDHRPALFRPIRTAEQIGAEERSKACDAMFGVLMNAKLHREGNRSDICEALYDAGYRKQENAQ